MQLNPLSKSHNSEGWVRIAFQSDSHTNRFDAADDLNPDAAATLMPVQECRFGVFLDASGGDALILVVCTKLDLCEGGFSYALV